MDEMQIFRTAFRRHAATVVVVTYQDDDGRPSGMTATSMCSLSASPPSLLVCVNRETRTHVEISQRERFGINLLSINQRSIAHHCSRPGGSKVLEPNWLYVAEPTSDTPRLRGALAHLECDVDAAHEAYSHSVFVGRITSVWLNDEDAPPLLYFGGLYSQLESDVARTERSHWELREG